MLTVKELRYYKFELTINKLGKMEIRIKYCLSLENKNIHAYCMIKELFIKKLIDINPNFNLFDKQIAEGILNEMLKDMLVSQDGVMKLIEITKMKNVVKEVVRLIDDKISKCHYISFYDYAECVIIESLRNLTSINKNEILNEISTCLHENYNHISKNENGCIITYFYSKNFNFKNFDEMEKCLIK